MIVTILTIVLSAPGAFFASFGREYLAPLAFIVLMLIFSQIIAAIGYGDYFPWAIPSLYIGLAGEEYFLGFFRVLIILLTGLLGIISTVFWWIFADQHLKRGGKPALCPLPAEKHVQNIHCC